MKKQFVTYEIALKLKELGFNEECLGYYSNSDKLIMDSGVQNSSMNKPDMHGTYCASPLWQQVIDWFRDKHEIIISIHYWGKRNTTLNNRILYPNLYNCTICQELTPKEKWIEYWYDNYHEARNQAILKAIELCRSTE